MRSRVVAVAASALVMIAAGCDAEDEHPLHLLDGSRAAEFRPVTGSVLTTARLVTRGLLGLRFAECLPPPERARFPSGTRAVDRVGVVSESLTFVDAQTRTIWACDAGVDPAREHARPWCGVSVGRLVGGRLLDPRLDVACRTRTGRPLAYAWIQPLGGTRWIGVDEGEYVEIYEVLGRLPVRVSGTRSVDPGGKATFEVTQYTRDGTAIVAETVEARVAG